MYMHSSLVLYLTGLQRLQYKFRWIPPNTKYELKEKTELDLKMPRNHSTRLSKMPNFLKRTKMEPIIIAHLY